MSDLLLLHAAATLAMTGLIWFVQWVHYPLFPFAALGNFPAFEAAHQRRTSWVVAPLMAVEMITAVLLALERPRADLLAWAGLFLLGLIWASTLLVQMPLHRQLARRYDDRLVTFLVHSNWVRTLAWSARAWIALRLLAP